MQFPIDLSERQFERLLSVFLDIVGREPWEKRARDIQRQLREVPTLRQFILERHRLEIDIAHFLGEMSNEDGKVPRPITNANEYAIRAFVATVARVFERLSPLGKRRLQGMLRDGLKSDAGLLPLNHEMTVATHLRSLGFDVDFRDMEGKAGADYIACKGRVELEVECKVISGDIGKMVHNKRAAQLFWSVLKACGTLIGSTNQCYFFRIVVPERLHCSVEQLEAIVTLVRSAIQKGSEKESSDAGAVTVHSFDSKLNPLAERVRDDLAEETVHRFINDTFGVGNVHMLFSILADRKIVAASIESLNPSGVLEAMLRVLKKSAKTQFSGDRPGILVVHLCDLSEDELVKLSRSDSSDPEKATGLQLMSSRFFSSPSCAHMLTLAFRAGGKVQRIRREGGDLELTTGGGTAYVFKNHRHAMSENSAYNLFSESPQIRAT